MIKKLIISRQGVLPAFVSYGPEPVIRSKLGELAEQQAVLRFIDRIPNAKQSSNISSALGVIDRIVFSNQQGARPNVPKSILVFVDKKNVDNERVLTGLAKKFKDKGTKLVVIGLGDDVDKDALRPLVHNNGAIFFPPTLAELDRVIQPVVAALSPGLFQNTFLYMIYLYLFDIYIYK